MFTLDTLARSQMAFNAKAFLVFFGGAQAVPSKGPPINGWFCAIFTIEKLAASNLRVSTNWLAKLVSKSYHC